VPPEATAAPVLLGDIGGTLARFCLADESGYGAIRTFATADYREPEAAILAFLQGSGISPSPSAAALACAGPVEHGRVQLTNSDWRIDAGELRTALGFEEVVLANDFAAIAWSIPSLDAKDLYPIGGGTAVPDAPAFALGPGTGLGVAAYVPHEGGASVIVGEGGHASMPATTEREAEVLATLRRQLGHVSAERVLSGDGLVLLYQTIAALDGLPAPPRTAAGVTDAALVGSCALCEAALDLFCEMLGTFAGNLALTFGAFGGVYIAGGIVPRLTDHLAASEFRRRFEAKGRFESYLARIPTSIVRHPEPAFLGLMRLRQTL